MESEINLIDSILKGKGHYYEFQNQTSKTKKNIEKFANYHYIEMWPLVDHYYDITTTTKKKTFDVVILPMASKKIATSKIKNIFLSNYLWHITYGYQGLVGPWGVWLGSIRLG
jgi:hypothetical protein